MLRILLILVIIYKYYKEGFLCIGDAEAKNAKQTMDVQINAYYSEKQQYVKDSANRLNDLNNKNGEIALKNKRIKDLYDEKIIYDKNHIGQQNIWLNESYKKTIESLKQNEQTLGLAYESILLFS